MREGSSSIAIYLCDVQRVLCALQPVLQEPDSVNLTHHEGAFFPFFSPSFPLSHPCGPTEVTAISSHGGGLLTGWGFAGDA